MLTRTTIAGQHAAAQHDPVRVLVVGAGVAGATVVQLLRGHGLHPVLVERAGQDAEHGYMLALLPMVDPVVRELGVREPYLASSVELRRYGFRSHTGRALREDPLAEMLKNFGDYRGISRGELLRELTAHGGTVGYDTTVTTLRQSPDTVTVMLATGDEQLEAEFDLVIVADGLHSATRELVAGAREIDVVDTGWGGWVAWADVDSAPDLGEELWGAGFFIGSYPVKDRIGVLVGGPRADTRVGPERFVARIRGELTTRGGRVDHVLDAVARCPDAYYWPLTDCRSRQWAAGRVVLLGDAAAGFLPTAGIGAGTAMESAWVLAGTLRDVGRRDIPQALRAYERTQRPRVEAAHNTSRRLARLMFRRSRALATVRDAVISLASIEAAVRPIKKLLSNRPM